MSHNRTLQLLAIIAFVFLALGQALAQGESESIAVEGRNLKVVVKGAGQPIVFVHGWLGNSSAWQQQLDYFSNFNRVVAVDLTGFGDSDKPSVETIEYDYALWDSDLAAVFDRLALEDAVLVGHSSGASGAIHYAANHPEHVSKLVLIGSIPLAPSEVTREEGAEFSGYLAGNFDQFVEDTVGAILSVAGTEAQRSELRAAMHQSTSEIAIESYWNYLLSDRRPLLAQIRVPTLVLHGGEDSIVPVASSEYIAQNIQDSELHVIPGGGHAPHITDPDLVNVLLYRFLSD